MPRNMVILPRIWSWKLFFICCVCQYPVWHVPSEDSWQVKGSALRSSLLPVRGSFLLQQWDMEKLHLNHTPGQRLGSTVTAWWQIMCSSSPKQVGRSRFQHFVLQGASSPSHLILLHRFLFPQSASEIQ